MMETVSDKLDSQTVEEDDSSVDIYTKSISRELGLNEVIEQENGLNFIKAAPKTIFLMVTLFSLLLWLCVSQGDYSGFSKPRMFGDFEAQRHWSCLTLHLPFHEWYTNSSVNDLEYWGLDYPPLTAFHMWGIGAIGQHIYPQMTPVECEKAKSDIIYQLKDEKDICPESVWDLDSRGIQSYSLKFYIRIHAIIGYFVVFYCSFLLFGVYDLFYQDIGLAFLFLNPVPLLLIDFGHFQYNSISLGFFILSIHYYLKRRSKYSTSFFSSGNMYCYIGSVFFILSLFYKIITLYFSLPTFFFCLFYNMKFEKKRFVILASIFISLFFLHFVLPMIISLGTTTPLLYENQEKHSTLNQENIILHLKQVIKRLFPFARGLYEDKVSNFWCATNFLFRWKSKDISTMKKVCLLFTLLFSSFTFYRIIYPISSPSNEKKGKRKGKEMIKNTQRVKFLKSLVITSFSFFFFSFHVHEKTILYPLVAWMVLNFYLLRERNRKSNGRVERKNIKSLTTLLMNHYLICSFSMFFLLRKDNLLLFYYVTNILMILFFFDFSPIFEIIQAYLTAPKEKSTGRKKKKKKKKKKKPGMRYIANTMKNIMVVSCVVLVHIFFHTGCLERFAVFRKVLIKYPFFWELLFSQISFSYFFVEIFCAVYFLV